MYTVDYFIKKFEAIPEEKWCTGTLQKGDKFCALGHCGVRSDPEYFITDEAVALDNIIYKVVKGSIEFLVANGKSVSWAVPSINDRGDISTPKQRILAALYDIKKLNQGTSISTERRNEVQSELSYVDQTKTFTNLIPVPEETSDLIPCEQL